MHHVGPIAGVAAYGPWVASAGYDNRLILWDSATRQALARANHDHLVNACAFSHDGRQLVSASSDYTARIWSLPDLRLTAVLAGHGDDVDMARFSPNDQLVATCALDRIVRVYDATGAMRHAMPGHSGNILSLAWIDSCRFVTSSVDGTLREWDAISGACLRVTDLGVRSDCVEIAADGRIVAGDDAGRIVVLDASGTHFVPAHAAGIKKLVLSKSGDRLVTLGYDRALAVWDLATGDLPGEIARETMPAQIWARAAAVCADGTIAVGTFGGTWASFDPVTSAWDMAGVAAGEAINAIAETPHGLATIGDAGCLRIDGAPDATMNSLCNFIAASGNRLFTGGHLGELYDAQSGALMHRHTSPLNCGAGFMRAGQPHLAIGTYTGEILIFSTGRDVNLIETLAAHANAVKSLVAGHGELMSVCANTALAWHGLEDLAERRRIPRAHTRIANAACVLAEGDSGPAGFATVGRDRMLRLWLPDGETAFATPHPNSVKSLASSPCGRWLASGSYGGTVALFDRASSRFVQCRRISKAGIAALCWHQAGAGFAAASYDGTVHSVALPDMALSEAAWALGLSLGRQAA
ncbi:MAG: WD40 repeat domain-containing protein [Sphingomonadales bacterium]|nr:WD40 repeat domain-containing protein [Sphingomonadales bacterium]MDE2170950.1 WD40 repeat domain-containing protein [Sphingomonadales bacterium]